MKHEIINYDLPIFGTSLQGYIDATYEDIVKAFGESKGPSMDGKVTNRWSVLIDGVLCTIYDYKKNLNTGEIERWHIGGRHIKCQNLVRTIIKEAR